MKRLIFKAFTDSDSLEINMESGEVVNGFIPIMKSVGIINIYPELSLKLTEELPFYIVEKIYHKMLELSITEFKEEV